MDIITIGENPAYLDRGIEYFQRRWANENSLMVYDDSIRHSGSESLPKWYLLMDGNEIIGGAGLITNDFISRMDLFPWLCALYIEEQYRGNEYGSLLLGKAKEDTAAMGYDNLYLSTDYIGFYERYGFSHIGKGFHPWGASSRIYRAKVR